MPTNTTTTHAATLTLVDRDRIAYEYRQTGLSWAHIAQLLGMANESSARTAGNRHALRIGAPHGHVAGTTTARVRRNPVNTVRGFGVEIEFVGATKASVAAAVARATGQAHVPVVGYHGNRCQCCTATLRRGEWKVEHDGSVSNGNGLHSMGGEVVTPPLYGEAGLTVLKAVMREMRAAGAQVDQRCGMHVHVAADHMTNAQRAEVLRTLYRHHDVLDRLVAPSRRRNQYCEKPSQYEIDSWTGYMEQTGSFGNGYKYRSLNVASFARYGTIEVRYHQGSLNGRKAAAWVRLLVGMFDTAAADQTGALAPGLALLGSLSDMGRLPQADAAYLTARADVLAAR